MTPLSSPPHMASPPVAGHAGPEVSFRDARRSIAGQWQQPLVAIAMRHGLLTGKDMKVVSNELPEEDRPSVHAAIERAGFAMDEFSFLVIKREVEFMRMGFHFRTAVVVTRRGGWTATYDLDEHLASRLEVDFRAGLFGAPGIASR